MSDALRIDLALAQAAGLPTRASSGIVVPRDSGATVAPSSPDALFSPLALLLTRFLPPPGTPAPTPTPEEAQLLLAYLQQRVVAVLQAAGMSVPSTLRVSVDREGALRLAPAPVERRRAATLLQEDPDVTRLAVVLRRPVVDITAFEGAATVDVGIATHPPVSARSETDMRRVWPWQWFGDGSTQHAAPRMSEITTPLVEAALGLGLIAALLLVTWLLS